MFTILNSLRLRSGYFQRKYYFILRFVAPCGALQNAFSREKSVRQATSPRPAGHSKTLFHVRSRYGKRHHRALRARSKAVSRKEHAYGKQHRNKPGYFFSRRSPCSISAGFTFYSALDAASLLVSAWAEEAVSSEDAFSGSAAALSADSDAAAEEAASLTPPRVVVPLSCCAALTARWICGSVSGV